VFLLVLLAASVSLNCSGILDTDDCPGVRYPPDTRCQITIKQGVWGNVWFWEGDFQPFCPTGTISPVVREVLAYNATNHDSVVRVGYGGFFSEIHTELIGKTTSNVTGFFELDLRAGKYSFFVREDTLFYANGGDGQGFIMPAKVVEDSVTECHIDITYKSYW